MEHMLMLAGIASVIFLIVKFVSMRYLSEEDSVPVKLLVRDALIVFTSIVMGCLLIDQFVLLNVAPSLPVVFTGDFPN